MRAKRLKTIVAVTAVMVSCLTGSFISQAAPGKPGKVIVESDPYDTMPDMPGVSFASDNGDAVQGLTDYEKSGMTFTTDRGVTTPGAFGSIDYKTGDTISTGHWQDVPLIDTQVGVGQHLYEYRKLSPIKIKEWKLAWYWAQCIHNSYPTTGDGWNGIALANRKKICQQYYMNITRGWDAVCAECGGGIGSFIYMTPETARNFYVVDGRYYYYYLCPFNENLEQAVQIRHDCKAISNNKYYVYYLKNDSQDSLAGGYMARSLHMYDNATEWEGNPITAQTKLSKNQYSRIGYKFVGWNTKADGSGESFTDEQEILNLTSEENGKIYLFAQWQLCTNQLIIDANGGTYAGQAKAQYTVNYGGSQAVNKSQVTAPSGYTIAFDGNGGSVQGMNTTELSSINGSTGKTLKIVRDVSEWTLNFGNTNSYMEYSGVNGTFYNKVPDPYDHILTVQYSDNTFKLPSATKSGSVFVGWKLSTGTTGDTSIHTQGETVTPSMSMSNSGYITYVAQYAEMTATVTPNYEKNNMAGAADLKWGWNASLTKKVYYQIYRDGTQISNETGGSAVTQPGKVVDSTTSGTYTVLYTGFYNFEAAGAAGGSYSGHSGGKGAVVKGGIFLNKGDKVNYQIAKYAGGTSSQSGAGTGGAATLVTVTRTNGTIENLVIAGGGGAATANRDGGSSTVLDSTLSGSAHTGGNGAYGGGAGNKPGSAGAYVYHKHTGSCYRTDSFTNVVLQASGNAGGSGGTANTWYSDFYNKNKSSVGYCGGTFASGYPVTQSIIGFGGHSGSYDNPANVTISVGGYAGSNTGYMPVTNCTKVTVDAYINGPYDNSDGYLAFCDQNGNVFKQINIADLTTLNAYWTGNDSAGYNSVNDNVFASGKSCKVWLDGKSWQDSDNGKWYGKSGTYAARYVVSVDIPAGTTAMAVRLHQKMSPHGASNDYWWDVVFRNITLYGSVKT